MVLYHYMKLIYQFALLIMKMNRIRD